ncbi:hypothetical protein CYMTET_11723 [Cymbomonas tetramitiformis]|uniref:Uncharacterized protein n=1 Tax=Cymbomonas tetramitiformis TaxID=36881 RepID=A0AAE0GLG9_9CHLO|nr:hypothetical protein CYMTET_11723 [Cymbomonas tetramitiformis]
MFTFSKSNIAHTSDEPYRGIPYTGRRPRSPTPEPDEEVTASRSRPTSHPDAHDGEEDGAGAAELAVEETPTDADKYETGIHGPGRPDQSEDIEDEKLTTKPADESSDDDSNPEEAPRRKKVKTDYQCGASGLAGRDRKCRSRM